MSHFACKTRSFDLEVDHSNREEFKASQNALQLGDSRTKPSTQTNLRARPSKYDLSRQLTGEGGEHGNKENQRSKTESEPPPVRK